MPLSGGFMIYKRVLLMSGFLSCFGLHAGKDKPKPENKKVEVAVGKPISGVQQIVCAGLLIPVKVATVLGAAAAGITGYVSEKTPDAVTVATCATVPWYLHGMHGYYQRVRNFANQDIVQYPRAWHRIKALDFKTFNKWHPIQSMKGTKHMMIPLIGPMIAAHATGIVYHGLTAHTYSSWSANQNAKK